jgi:hypothetical protein
MAGYSNGSEVRVGAQASVIGTNVASDSDRDTVPAVSQSAQVDADSATALSSLPLWGSILAFALLAVGALIFGLRHTTANVRATGIAAETKDSLKRVTEAKSSSTLTTSAALGTTQNACSLLTLNELSEGLGSSFEKAEPSINGDDEISCEYAPGEGNIYPASLTVTLQNGKVAMETLRGVGTKIIAGTKAESDLGDESFYMPMDVGIYALKGDILVSLQFGLGKGTREQKQALVRKVLSRF